MISLYGYEVIVEPETIFYNWGATQVTMEKVQVNTFSAPLFFVGENLTPQPL